MFANLQGALLFGKITVTIGDDQTHVARCRLSRRGEKIHLIQNSVAECVPGTAVLIQRCATPDFALEVQRAGMPGHPGTKRSFESLTEL